MSPLPADLRRRLQHGLVIPAHPLALNAERRLDERRQRALTRYYLAAGAGGIAVAVHTTQFAIRQASVGLLRPVLELAIETMRQHVAEHGTRALRFAGICGDTAQAVAEADQAMELGYDIGLLSLAALGQADDDALIAHCETLAEIMPICGFYLQPAVGGRVLDYRFWRRFAEIPGVVAIKVAPFDRYQTLEVVRAVAAADRDTKIALYTGNDDHIIGDLTAEYRFGRQQLRFCGGLLGHWAVWTRGAVDILAQTRTADQTTLRHLDAAVTDCNAAFFDARNSFSGCIAGLHEVLRRQGLLEGLWCLDPDEGLSSGQLDEIDRVYAAYPQLNDDAFVAEHLDAWLR